LGIGEIKLSDIQKLAALLLRFIGASVAFLVSFGFAFRLVETSLGLPVQAYPTHTIGANIFYIILGLALVKFSKPLGRLFGGGLE
jgi:hypothetical protein